MAETNNDQSGQEEEESDDDFELVDEEEEMVDALAEQPLASGDGCSHYNCKCSIIAPCCNKEYFCRLCHNEAEEHEVDRFSVQEIVCRDCKTKQPPAERCSKCDLVFASYVCLKCRLFDFTEKGQWHCEGCGICRVGGKEKFFHCDTCGYCLALDLKGSHRCVRDASKNFCAICLLNLHDSRIPLTLPKCGHPVHQTCYRQMISHKVYTCPTCKESVVETDWQQFDEVMNQLLRDNPIPEDQVRDVEIICNDCHKKANVKDYYIGLFKCPHCGSYNTQR